MYHTREQVDHTIVDSELSALLASCGDVCRCGYGVGSRPQVIPRCAKCKLSLDIYADAYLSYLTDEDKSYPVQWYD